MKGHTFRSVINIVASEGKLPKKIEVLPVGNWNTNNYGPMSVTPAILQQMVSNFQAGVRKMVPIDVDHDGGKAAGWINELEYGSTGLWASVEWTPYGEQLLKNKEYRLFSPEWSFDYVDPEYGSRHGPVLIAGSLTNRPLFKELDMLVASDQAGKITKDLTNEKTITIMLSSDIKVINKNDSMNIKDILSKKASERTEEEVKFLVAHEKEFDETQKTQIATEKAEADKIVKEASDKKIADDKKKADDKIAADKLAKENVTIKASELADLRKAKEENVKAQEQLRQVATEKEITAFIANDKGGKILPKSKDAVVAFVMKCSEEQKKAFYEIVTALPDIKIAGEKGEAGQMGLTAKEQIDIKIVEARKADDKLSNADATSKVLKEFPDLANKYQAELDNS
jgi:phage I-like protein